MSQIDQVLTEGRRTIYNGSCVDVKKDLLIEDGSLSTFLPFPMYNSQTLGCPNSMIQPDGGRVEV